MSQTDFLNALRSTPVPHWNNPVLDAFCKRKSITTLDAFVAAADSYVEGIASAVATAKRGSLRSSASGGPLPRKRAGQHKQTPASNGGVTAGTLGRKRGRPSKAEMATADA